MGKHSGSAANEGNIDPKTGGSKTSGAVGEQSGGGKRGK